MYVFKTCIIICMFKIKIIKIKINNNTLRVSTRMCSVCVCQCVMCEWCMLCDVCVAGMYNTSYIHLASSKGELKPNMHFVEGNRDKKYGGTVAVRLI